MPTCRDKEEEEEQRRQQQQEEKLERKRSLKSKNGMTTARHYTMGKCKILGHIMSGAKYIYTFTIFYGSKSYGISWSYSS